MDSILQDLVKVNKTFLIFFKENKLKKSLQEKQQIQEKFEAAIQLKTQFKLEKSQLAQEIETLKKQVNYIEKWGKYNAQDGGKNPTPGK